MWAKFKLAAGALGILAISILYGRTQKAKADLAEDRLETASTSLRTQTKAAQALADGTADEHETMVEPVDTENRENF